MELSLSLLPIITALLVAGFASGVLAGLLGVGGGIILVPVLFQVFIFMGLPTSLQIHMAVGTSLAIICFTSWQSARAHYKKGAVDTDILKEWGAFIIIGALSGAIIARTIAPDGLKIIFAGFSLLLGIRSIVSKDSGEGKHIGLPPFLQKITAGVIGFLSALMGIGGGTFSVPLLGVVGRNVHQAVATSAAMGFLIAIPATLGFVIGGWNIADLPAYSLGYVHLLAMAIMIPTAMAGAPVGARLAHRLSRRTLTYIFAVFLLLGAGRMIVSLF